MSPVMINGTVVIIAPYIIQIYPPSFTIVSIKSFPAPNPTQARNKEIPISLIIKLALIVVYVIILYWGPKRLIRMDTISGPPARPSFTGCGIPGNINGILPKIHPNAMPKKMGIRLGWFSLFMEFPKTFSAWVTASSLPTIVTRSPICNCKCGEATKSTPERLIRVMLAPKLFRILSCESIFPFNSGFVIKMRREISFLFNCSHSISTCLPKNTVIASMSIGFEITRILSSICNIVSEFTSSTSCCPSWWRMREMTKLRFTKGRISLMVFPCIASFFISNVTGRTVSSCKCPNPFSASASSCDVLILRMYFSASNERMAPTTPKG